jgi:hypothetical protein
VFLSFLLFRLSYNISVDCNLQLYSLDDFASIKSITLPEPIFYWRWVTDEELGIVTTSTVYHWTIHGELFSCSSCSHPVKDADPPRKKFLRSFESSFESAQIINYQVSPGGLWCLLIGLIFLPHQQEPSGVLQMYSVKKGASQNVRGRNGVFVTIQPEGYASPIQVHSLCLSPYCFLLFILDRDRLSVLNKRNPPSILHRSLLLGEVTATMTHRTLPFGPHLEIFQVSRGSLMTSQSQ